MSKLKTAVIYIGLGILLVSIIANLYLNKRLQSLESELVELREAKPAIVVSDKTLAQNQQLLLQLNQNVLTLLQRVDSTRVEVETRYIPPEGGYTVVIEENPAIRQALDSIFVAMSNDSLSQAYRDSLYLVGLALMGQLYQPTIDYQLMGVCFTPWIGPSIDDDAAFGVDAGARLLYSGRFGVGPMFSTTPLEEVLAFRAGGFVDYRVPKLDNLAPRLFGAYDFTNEDWEIGVGLDLLLK